MSTYKFYSRYKKVKKEKIFDDSIPILIASLIRETDAEVGNFLKSLQDYYDEHQGLTRKQFSALKDIKKSTMERTTAEHIKWAAGYDDEKRKIAKICAQYYKANPPYYSYLVEKILNQPEYVPTEKQYISMCDNNFTKKVLCATLSEPKYKPGSLIQGRKNAPDEFTNKKGTVVAVNERPVVSAAKGAKIYSILFFGENHVKYCEERYLKKIKKT